MSEQKRPREDTVEIDGTRVKTHREQLDRTQADLAEAINRSRSYISTIEGQPRIRVSREVATGLAEQLRLPLQELLVAQPAATPPARRRRGLFGAGFPVTAMSRHEALTELYRQAEEISRRAEAMRQ